jgi:ferritin-like metal-binding protein YciE
VLSKPDYEFYYFMKNKSQTPDNGAEQGQEMNQELHELFLDELADLLNAETQLTKALPKMAKAAQSDELKEAITSHLEETEGHVDRLKQVFESLDEKPKSKTCKAMKGLIEEGSELLQELKGKSSIDAGIIAAAQKVEHYEIASYGTVKAWAEQMGHDEAVRLLEETLEEEKAADDKLTDIAESVANTRPE